MNEENKNTDLPENGAENEWMEIVKTAFFAVLLAVTIRSFVAEPFNIPSGSMKPNLLVGDYLFVSKYAYGYSRYSFPFGLAPIPGRVWAEKPKRADIAVFKLPSDNRTDYIKRVIGMPGDTIQVRNGRLFLNGEMVKRDYIKDVETTDGKGRPQTVKQYRQTLPTGESFMIYEVSDYAPLDNTPIFTVPEGHYFMMGDNRDNSTDSRVGVVENALTNRMMGVGPVPFENFVGRAEFLFFSTNGSAKLWEPWKWPITVRYDRLFDKIK